MEREVNLERNKVFYLEDSMVMFGIYNAEMIEKLDNTLVEIMHNNIAWNKR